MIRKSIEILLRIFFLTLFLQGCINKKTKEKVNPEDPLYTPCNVLAAKTPGWDTIKVLTYNEFTFTNSASVWEKEYKKAQLTPKPHNIRFNSDFTYKLTFTETQQELKGVWEINFYENGISNFYLLLDKGTDKERWMTVITEGEMFDFCTLETIQDPNNVFETNEMLRMLYIRPSVNPKKSSNPYLIF
ncbi:MAG: hypothetical protein EAZ07_06180 [Cytophagales bacterium]|nr:MAG: hypothetical protein EAZ07_06180 [Cytophagales bacterium]